MLSAKYHFEWSLISLAVYAKAVINVHDYKKSVKLMESIDRAGGAKGTPVLRSHLFSYGIDQLS